LRGEGAEPIQNLWEQGSGGHSPPEAVSNFGLKVLQTPLNWGISTITQSYFTISI